MAMDKLHEESRKQFEDFVDSNFPYKKDRFLLFRGEYNSQFTRQLWQAWQASRASIVVDTPQLCGDGENDSEYTDGYNDGVTATEKTIRSIGLAIKGE